MNPPKIRRPRKYKFDQIQLGDYTEYPAKTSADKLRIQNAALSYALRNKVTFITRRTEKGLWVGRTK